MAVTIVFNAILPDASMRNLSTSSSGMGFFGSGGFGASVAVGTYQDTTFITDGNGVDNGGQANNIKYTDAATGLISGTDYALRDIPNSYAPLNIRVNSDDGDINVRNVNLYIYDRVYPTHQPSGVTTQVAEIVHPTGDLSVGNNQGSGSLTWTFLQGAPLTLKQSPGISGLNAGASEGSSTIADTGHDWFIALSAMPQTIGSKTGYGLYVSLEYL